MNSAILVQNKTLQTTLRVQYYSTSWPMPTWNTFEYLQACLCPCANTHFWAYTMIWYPKNCTKLNSVQNDENYNKLYKECTSSIMFKCGRLSSRYHQDHLVSISQFLPNSHYCTHKKFSFHFSFLLLLQQSNLLSSLNLSSKVQLRRNRFGSINYQKTSFPRRCQKKLQKNWTYCRFFLRVLQTIYLVIPLHFAMQVAIREKPSSLPTMKRKKEQSGKNYTQQTCLSWWLEIRPYYDKSFNHSIKHSWWFKIHLPYFLTGQEPSFQPDENPKTHRRSKFHQITGSIEVQVATGKVELMKYDSMSFEYMAKA